MIPYDPNNGEYVTAVEVKAKEPGPLQVAPIHLGRPAGSIIIIDRSLINSMAWVHSILFAIQ